MTASSSMTLHPPSLLRRARTRAGWQDAGRRPLGGTHRWARGSPGRHRDDADPGSAKRLDHYSDFAQVIVELMIAVGQEIETCMRNRACIELSVRRWHGAVRKAVIEINRPISRELAPKSRTGCPSSLGQPPSPTNGTAIRKMAPNASLGGCSARTLRRIVPPTE